MNIVSLRIDDVQVTAEAGSILLQAALDAGIYIPHLCAHPALPPFDSATPSQAIFRGSERIETQSEDLYEGCGLCAVEVEGMDAFVLACNTPVKQGMRIITQSPDLTTLRQKKLAGILKNHPHACLSCAQREGCSLTQCSSNVPERERCCEQFNRCELRKVAEHVGIPQDLPRYVFRDLPRVEDDPLFDRDYNLCIGCMRCVRACADAHGEAAIGFVQTGEGIVAGTLGPSLAESGCRFCGICVEVCPTGAITDRDIQPASRESELLPCKHGCPMELDIPQYARFIANGDFSGAARVIQAKTPMASILGMVCFHPCEDACRRGQVSEPVAICALKRFAMEQGAGPDVGERPSIEPTGRKAAILGSGPAGLTAAYYLAGQGHAVTVFEAMEEPGGMLRYGIPRYRLPLDVLSREIDAILSHDLIEVRTNTRVGESIGFEEFKDQGFDAVLIAAGTQAGKTLPLDGVESSGVREGMEFLREIAKGAVGGRPFVKRKVVVIGGGNVAVDAARTAIRLGAAKVDLVCLESRDRMPGHEKELIEAEEEGVKIHPSWGPARILCQNGRSTAVELKRCIAVFDDQGRFNPSFDEDVRQTLEANEIIVAIGQEPDLSFLGDGRANLAAGALIDADAETMQTSMKGVFAAGDVLNGPSSVVEAVASGKKAARAIDLFLGGDGNIDREEAARSDVRKSGRIEGFANLPRVPVPCLDPESRVEGFRVVEAGFNAEAAMAEARRCLMCDLRFRLGAVVLPPEKWLEFCAANVDSVPGTEGVFRLLDENKEIICITGTQNLRQSLSEKLEEGSNAASFFFEPEPMYTKRESELIQQYLQEHGKMPGGGEDDLDDLF